MSISVEKSGNGFRWVCTCGRTGNEYPTEGHARSIGEAHVKYMHTGGK